MKAIWNSIFGPKLFRIYTIRQQLNVNNEHENSVFVPNCTEKIGDNIIRGINVLWNISLYTSPLIITYLYKRDYFCLQGCLSLGKLVIGIGLLLVISMFIRGIGRTFNISYITFLRTLQDAHKDYSFANKVAMSRYDFEFWAWPVDFNVWSVEGNDKSYAQAPPPLSNSKVGPVANLISFPCYLSSYLCIHLFGRHLIYPGSVHLLQFIIDQALQIGREKLVKEHSGIRSKIVTRDENEIDTMFVDRRNSKVHSNGSTLVICCEGNASFYEVGLMQIPLDAEYSVLGWNHPGFSGSTGKPFPAEDQHGMDGVMQYAIHKLNFQPEDIIIYAWSIGGYSGTWAAMNYPEIRGLILDATFDHVLPLAIPRMPTWMSGIVKTTIREFMNLNNAEQLCKFPGPVTIIRRTKDEIITTTEGDITTNRGNNLLLKLLNYRFPTLISSNQASETLNQWVSEDSKIQNAIYKKLAVDEELCLTQLVSYMTERGNKFPMHIGDDWNDDEKTRMLLFVAKKIFINFASPHNNPLDVQYFKEPWAPNSLI